VRSGSSSISSSALKQIEPLKKEEISDWLQLLASIGVLAGLDRRLEGKAQHALEHVR